MFKTMPLAAALLATSSLTLAAALVTEQANAFKTPRAQSTALSTTDTWERRGSRDSSAAALPADRSAAALIQPRRGERAPSPTVANNAFDPPDALVRRGTR